jgi:hypothetical protein
VNITKLLALFVRRALAGTTAMTADRAKPLFSQVSKQNCFNLSERISPLATRLTVGQPGVVPSDCELISYLVRDLLLRPFSLNL